MKRESMLQIIICLLIFIIAYTAGYRSGKSDCREFMTGYKECLKELIETKSHLYSQSQQNNLKMKNLISIRSNSHYTERLENGEFQLIPGLELIIIHTDGKTYRIEKDRLDSAPKVSEFRLIVNPDLLESLIAELQLHQAKLNVVRGNAEQINILVKHLNKEPKGAKPTIH